MFTRDSVLVMVLSRTLIFLAFSTEKGNKCCLQSVCRCVEHTNALVIKKISYCQVCVCVCVPCASLSTLVTLRMLGLMGRRCSIFISLKMITMKETKTIAMSSIFQLKTHTHHAVNQAFTKPNKPRKLNSWA